MLPAFSLIEYQYDSVPSYNSPQFRRKITNTGYDSVSGLSFEKQYFFRCRYVNANGDPTSNWSQTVYSTATYPLPELFNQNTPKAFLNTPIYNYLHRYTTYFELWFDTVSSFNSSRLKKFSSNTLYTYHKLALIKNHQDYYLRARVVDGSASLPWKTVHVQNVFKPNVSFNSNGGCTDTSIAYYLSFYNYLSDAVSFSNKTKLKYGTYQDSFSSNSLGINLQIKDSNSVYFYTRTLVNYDSSTLEYTDTQVFRNLLGSNGQTNYTFRSMPQNAIYFSGNSCNTNIELELYADSTLATLLKSQSKSNGKFGADIWFETDWDYFKKNVMRYRSVRFGIKSDWQYIYPKDFKLRIDHPIQAAQDTTFSQWTIYRNFLFPGKKLEVLLDVNGDFNSPKLKTFLINDSSEFYLESLFDFYNYTKCRIRDGVNTSNWSNVVGKPFTSAPMNGATLNISHPTGNLYYYPFSRLGGIQMQMGTNPSQYQYNIFNAPNMFTDTFDFVKNEQVYYRLRRYTPIDTSVWSKAGSFIYKTDPGICISPVIIYNGNRFGRDTFNIRWKEKDPSSSTGYYLYLSKGPFAASIEGIIEIAANSTSINLRRNDFPLSYYYAIYPKCANNRAYSQVQTKWFPLNPLLGLDAYAGDETEYIFFNQDKKLLMSQLEIESQCEVYDLNGKCLFKGVLSAMKPVYLPTLSSGIYFVKQTNQNLSQTTKFIVQ